MELSIHSDEYFMKQAMVEAQRAFDEDEVPVGAVVVCKNQIIARAHNETEKLSDVTAHAEMLAITSASNYLGGKFLNECTLYVTLEPCNMCGGAIYWSRFKKIVFATSDPKRGYSLYSEEIIHPKTEVKRGVMADESRKLLQTFFESKRK